MASAFREFFQSGTTLRIIGIVLALVMLAGPLAADPKGKGGGGNKGGGKGGPPHAGAFNPGGGPGKAKGGGNVFVGPTRFVDNDRLVIRNYYGPLIAGGSCPPGLAKKGNGCLPPGQAKRWIIGQPLPYGVDYYDLEPDLLYRLSPPPVGYRYTRVGSDILMLAIGTGLVVSAISNLAQ